MLPVSAPLPSAVTYVRVSSLDAKVASLGVFPEPFGIVKSSRKVASPKGRKSPLAKSRARGRRVSAHEASRCFCLSRPSIKQPRSEHKVIVGHCRLNEFSAKRLPPVGTINGRRSVSYTHLDVYKRQTLNTDSSSRGAVTATAFGTGTVG